MASMTGNAGTGVKTPNPPGFNLYLTSYVSLAKSLNISELWLFIHKIELMPPLSSGCCAAQLNSQDRTAFVSGTGKGLEMAATTVIDLQSVSNVLGPCHF